MAANFIAPNEILHLTLGAAGVQTEVNFHRDAHACVVDFLAPGDLTASAAGQVAFTGEDGAPIGANKWRPVPANTDWPFALQYEASVAAIQKIYLSSLTAGASVVVTSLEAPQ